MNDKQDVDVIRNDNPNWQFVGKLQDINVFQKEGKLFSYIKTSTTFFVIKDVVSEAVHIGQTVKLSKRDNAAKIGPLLVYRPDEGEQDLTVE